MGSVLLYALFSVICEKSALNILLSTKVGSFYVLRDLYVGRFWFVIFLSFFFNGLVWVLCFTSFRDRMSRTTICLLMVFRYIIFIRFSTGKIIISLFTKLQHLYRVPPV